MNATITGSAKTPGHSKHRWVVLLLTALLLASCGGGQQFTTEDQVPRDRADDGAAEPTPTEAPAAELLFVAEDIVYVDPPTEAPSGPLSITIENQGNLVHNVVFEGLDGDEPVVEAQGGESDTATIELTPREYVFYCSIPGHREAGMEGTLTVS